MMSTRLKPCKVCGKGSPLAIMKSTMDNKQYIFCLSCETQSERAKTKAGAIYEWNKLQESEGLK